MSIRSEKAEQNYMNYLSLQILLKFHVKVVFRFCFHKENMTYFIRIVLRSFTFKTCSNSGMNEKTCKYAQCFDYSPRVYSLSTSDSI